MVDINWPDISQNQLMHVGLGLLGSGFGRGQTNPYLAAAQGLSYGSQADAFSEEQRRLKAEEDRRAAAQARWEAMFNAYGAGGGSDMAGGPSPGNQPPLQPYNPADLGFGAAGPDQDGFRPTNPPTGHPIYDAAQPRVRDPLDNVQFASAGMLTGGASAPDLAGMGQPGGPPGGMRP